jgi:2-amino-4-hydroxy-6-hydroxymethyldihydropteridine diphosphokinase
MLAWIGLGGNREGSDKLLSQSLALLRAVPGIRVVCSSRQYSSPAWGLTEQADFVNAVAQLETELEPFPLLQQLLTIESRLGRDRGGVHWGPRCIDLDLLTYDEVMLQSAALTLPHPSMHLRAFVLVPLLELEPGFVIPGIGPAVDCLQNIDPQERTAVRPVPIT